MAQPLDFLSKEEVALLKRTMLSKFPEDEQETFIRICQRTRLDPFTKQVYATRRYNKVKDDSGDTKKVPTLVAVTGIMGLTAVADRTHDYDGCEIFWAGKDGEWKSEWLADEVPEAAKCIVYHKHRNHPEVGIARWGSYAGQNYNYQKKEWELSDFWAKMPDYMLAKCAKAQAIRGAFPDPTSNVFIREELDSDITDAETETSAISVDEQKIIDNRRKEAEVIKQFPHVVSSPPVDGPSPEQMAEPADVHKAPAKPKEAPTPETKAPEPKADDIKTEPSSPMTDIAVGGMATDLSNELPQPGAPPWRDRVIVSVSNARFHGRRVGELNQRERDVIENQWLPKIRDGWEVATDDQRADALAFESAIAYHKMEGVK